MEKQFIVDRTKIGLVREESSYWKRLSCALVLLIIWDLVPRVGAKSYEDRAVTTEICESETFNVSCGHNEVLVIRSAFYGQMRQGRCNKTPLPYIGCVAEVSKIVGHQCNGRRHCSFMVPDDGLRDIHPCPGNLGAYLEISYECVTDPTEHSVVDWSPTYTMISVSDSKILHCNVPYPENIHAEYMVTWRKYGKKDPIIVHFNGYPSHIDSEYEGRLRLVEKAATCIKLENILQSDEGWYECCHTFVKGSRSESDGCDPNSTWTYLAVHTTTEICQSETFNVSCGHNEVLVIRSAFYGRMRQSRCNKTPLPGLPSIGCAAEVSQIVGDQCTGSRHCSFMVPDDRLRDIHPCPENLGAYLEISYECVTDPTEHSVVDYKMASVSDSKILRCNIPYPENTHVEYMITWRKNGKKDPVLIHFNGYPSHIDKEYEGRFRFVEKAAIKLENILQSDEGWYECCHTFVKGSRSESDGCDPNSTWTYLAVHTTTEICQSETFNVSCGHNEVLVIRSAFYGRMRRSRCNKFPYRSIGCAAEVSQIVGVRCTGHRHCSFMVPDDGLPCVHPCPGIFDSYLEISYECVRGQTYTYDMIRFSASGHSGRLSTSSVALFLTWLISIKVSRFL